MAYFGNLGGDVSDDLLKVFWLFHGMLFCYVDMKSFDCLFSSGLLLPLPTRVFDVQECIQARHAMPCLICAFILRECRQPIGTLAILDDQPIIILLDYGIICP